MKVSNSVRKKIERILRTWKGQRLRRRIARFVSAVMVFVTVYALILPAITLEQETAAGMAGVDLGEAPAVSVQAEGTPAGTTAADTVAGQNSSGQNNSIQNGTGQRILACHVSPHVHTEACWKEVNGERILICGKADYIVHEHDDACYTIDTAGNRILVCTLPEIKEHTHDSTCYSAVRGELVCTQQEHVHTDSCYTTVQTGTERALVCGYGEGEMISPPVTHTYIDENTGQERTEVIQDAVMHYHTDACYAEQPVYEQQLICQIPEHTHTDACYVMEQTLTCEKQEIQLHTHTLECYEKGSEGESPVEMGWVSYDKNGTLTGDPAHLICGKPEVTAHTHTDACFSYETAFGEGMDFAIPAAAGAATTDAAAADTSAQEASEDASSEENASADTEQNPAQQSTEVSLNRRNASDSMDNAVNSSEDVMESADKDTESGENTADSADNDADSDEDATDSDKQAEDTDDDAAPVQTEAAAFSQEIAVAGADYTLIVSGNSDCGIPEGATFAATALNDAEDTYASYRDQAITAVSEVSEAEASQTVFGLFDLSIYDDEGKKIQPAAPVSVTVHFQNSELSDALGDNGSVYAVHFPGTSLPEAETVQPAAVRKKLSAKSALTARQGFSANTSGTELIPAITDADGIVSFQAESFSFYAIVYTVDFEYSVNGKMYQFSLPGGGFVSFTDLVEVLGISGGTNSEENEDKNDSEIAENAEENAVNTGVEENGVNSDTNATLTLSDVEVSEATRKFVVDVASVEFSSPELVDVSKVDADTTVGQIKESRGLDVEYSAELTEEQIAEINAQTVETGDWALISLQSFVSEETLTVTMKNGEVFTIQVTDPRITAMYLSDNGDLYEVTVIYDENANIPEGSSLRVTEFAENSEKYDYARNSVLADKKARDEQVDLGSFALAALDISILNPAGEEIEPEAPVQVEIRIKELPGVEDLSEVADTLAIQHHVEVEDGVVVETVFDGSTQASFKMETNETVAAEGIAVDPNSVSEEDFAPSNVTPLDFEAIEGVNGFQTNKKTITFEVKAFSTFTVTWLKDRDSSNSTMNLRWTSGYGYYATTYSNLTLHYFDTAGNPITSPLGDQTVSNGQNVSVTTGNYTNIPGYQFDHAWVWVDQSQGRYIPLDTVNFRFSIDNYWLGNYYYRSTPTIYIQQNGNNLIYGQYVNNQTFSNDVYLYFRKVSGDTLSATIHYVDEAGNELAVSNGQPVNDTYEHIVSWYWSEEDQDYTIPAERWYFNSLIYDVEGYEYAYTYRNAEENRITPILNYRGDSWKYTSGEETYGPSNTWTNLSDKDDIYVVYKKKSDVSTGGTPEPKITGEKPETPTITKESVVNGDGTNTLSLSVTGHTSVMEAEKLADVIVVYDVSGSMNFRMDSETEAVDGERRMDYAQTATKALAESLLGKNTTEHPNLIRMSLISFSNTAEKRQGFTTDLTTFNDAVTSLPSPDGGTNWEYALQLANEMAVESDRATFVIFVTDGNPTFRQTRGVLNNGGEGGIGDEDVSGNYFNYNVYGTGYSDKHGRNYAAALKQAQSIVSHNKNFYTIGISDDVTNLTKLTTQAGAGADHSKTATSNDALVAAFNEIAASIIAYLGHSDVQITDGITDLTQTVQKSDLVNFKEDDFTYYKERLATEEEISDSTKIPEGAVIETRDGVKYTVWNDWDPTSEGCAKAVYNTTTKAVEWNMGESFMLEDGCTYQVRFKVWPSQKAYDLLADLNNGKNSYDSLTDAEKAQISEPTEAGGMYTLKTNSETSYTYREATKSGDTVTPTGDPSKPGSFPDVDPLELTTKPLKIQKLWHNNYAANVETVESITLELYDINASGQERQTFKTITLTGDEVTDENGVTRTWYSANNYISYGLITLDKDHPAADTRKVYETGHDFTLREVGINAHYFELTSGIFRPMVINGTPTVLQRADDGVPAGMSESVFYYTDGTHEYYRIDGHVYVDTQSDIVLIATNSRRSYMDLKKEVVDESRDAVVDDTEFEYKITFTVPPTIDNYETVEKYIWFSVYDSVARRTLSPSEYTCTGVITPAQENAELFSSAEYANYLVAISGQEVTLKIKQGWNVRFLNLANGTIYSFTETNIPDGYSFVKAEVSGTRWIANMVNGEDKGSAVTMTGLPSNNSGSNTETVISGTIQFANARYSTTYTNKTLTRKVNILKTSQDGVTPLSGAVFSLYTKSGYEADPRKASKTDLASNEDGKIELGGLAYGKYYLVETAAPEGYVPLSDPVEITVNGSGVTYVQHNSTLSQSNKGISYNQETEVYTLTVTNNAGYELPATGGPGTKLFYLYGTMLTVLASTGLLLKRQKKKAA